VRSKICFMSDHRPTTSTPVLQQAPQYAAPAARRAVRVQGSHTKSCRSCTIGTKLFLPDRSGVAGGPMMPVKFDRADAALDKVSEVVSGTSA
jgi:hypothetical protein